MTKAARVVFVHTPSLKAQIAILSSVSLRCIVAMEEVRRGRFPGLFESAMDAIVTTDGDQRIVGWNAAAARMLGCGAADALGRSLGNFISRNAPE